MARRTHNAMYFADDKDIHDMFATAKQRLSTDRLRSIARKRGIYLSRHSSRESLIDYLTSLSFNWPQLRALVASTETPDRPERSTYTEVRGQVDRGSLDRTLEQLRAASVENNSVTLQIARNKSGAYSISAEYSELDPSKTRLFQRKTKTLQVEVELSAEKMRVRHSDNPRAQEIVDKILSSVVTEPEKTPVSRIDLSAIHSPALRSEFFIRMMTKMTGFRLEDGFFMGVARIPTDNSSDTEDDESDAHQNADLDLDSDDEADRDADAENTLSPAQRKVISVVKRAALEGQNLLASKEYQAFSASGFFISKSSWFAIEESGDRRRVEFDARFADPQNAKGFGYKVVATYEPTKTDRYRRLPASSIKDTDLFRKLEDAARRAADEVTAEFATLSAASSSE